MFVKYTRLVQGENFSFQPIVDVAESLKLAYSTQKTEANLQNKQVFLASRPSFTELLNAKDSEFYIIVWKHNKHNVITQRSMIA